jgi:purine-nucleoside phosphorylase
MTRIEEAREQQRRRIETAAEAVASHNPGAPPEVALVLGTGLGDLVSEITDAVTIPYQEIPGFPVSTAPGHAGRLHIGQIGKTRALVFEGRFHLYEGWQMDDIVLPMRMSCRLGVSSAIISNSCGGMSKNLQKGDLLILDDHINLLGANPLTGANHDDWGPRFPDMSEPYCLESAARLAEIASEEQIRASRGVYVAVCGPNLETRAEYRMLHSLGADVVGMSTVPEVIAARHAGMRVMAFSCITNLAAGLSADPLSHDEVIETTQAASGDLARFLEAFLEKVV